MWKGLVRRAGREQGKGGFPENFEDELGKIEKQKPDKGAPEMGKGTKEATWRRKRSRSQGKDLRKKRREVKKEISGANDDGVRKIGRPLLREGRKEGTS